MKTRLMAVALLVTVLTFGLSNQASAHPWGGGHWCGPHVRVRVAVPMPGVVVGGGYYGGYAPAPYYGDCAPAPAPYCGDAYYGGGYYAYPRYRAYGYRGGWGHREYAYGGGYGRGYEHRGGYERGGYGGYGGRGGYGPRGGGYGYGHRR
ncbi:MAG: hypothetical protein JSS96_05235 [Bacteroidetes bacterium]|nr:hypothetical protein [Bacteroidota bacterium]